MMRVAHVCYKDLEIKRNNGERKDMAEYHEYDLVCIRQLLKPDRYYDGKRAPCVGDRGTIVHIPPETNTWCIIESVDKNGLMIWLADFVADELELVEVAK